jgi:hypothetical protein
MTATSAPHQPALAAGPRPRRRYLPAAAGAAYLAAWAAGLAAWPSNLALNATSAQTAAAYQAHPAGAVAQYLLAEGLAGLLLGVVLAAVLLPRAPGRLARPAVAAAAVAVVISVTQCVLGLVLVAAATSAEVSRAGSLSALENRLDGVKMLAMASVAAYLAARGRARGAVAGPQPRWLRAIAGLAAAALVSSAVAYLFRDNAIAWAVYLSGPLLLLWIAATGTWLTFVRRPAADRS